MRRAPDAVQHHADTWRRWGNPAQWTDELASPSIAFTWRACSVPIHDAAGVKGRRTIWPAPDVWPNRDTGDHVVSWVTVLDLLDRAPVRFLWWTLKLGKAKGISVPWADSFRWATSDWAVESDNIILIDDDAARPELGGWEILGCRLPWPHEEALLGAATGGAYRSGDLVATQVHRRTATNVGSFVGRGCGRRAKRRGIVTPAAVTTGRFVDPIAVVGFNLETGPKASHRGKDTRVEHPNGAPLRPDGTPVHPDAPDPRLVPAVLHLAADERLTDDEITRRLDARRLTGPYRRSVENTWKATRLEGGVGIEIGVETGHGSCQAECTTMADGYVDAPAWRAAGFTTPEHARDVFVGYPWEFLVVVE